MTYRPCKRCEESGDRNARPRAAWGRSPLCWACLAEVRLLVDADGTQLDVSDGPGRARIYAARYRYRPVKCGKEDCSSCPHEHYVYLCWRVDGKAKERYLGPAGDLGDNYELPELRATATAWR